MQLKQHLEGNLQSKMYLFKDEKIKNKEVN